MDQGADVGILVLLLKFAVAATPRFRHFWLADDPRCSVGSSADTPDVRLFETRQITAPTDALFFRSPELQERKNDKNGTTDKQPEYIYRE